MCVVVCVRARVTAFPDSNVQSVFFCSTEKKIAQYITAYPGTPAKLVEGSTGGAVLFAGKEGAAYVLRTTPPFKLLVSKKERGWGGG